jgi:hypothetical protein
MQPRLDSPKPLGAAGQRFGGNSLDRSACGTTWTCRDVRNPVAIISGDKQTKRDARLRCFREAALGMNCAQPRCETARHYAAKLLWAAIAASPTIVLRPGGNLQISFRFGWHGGDTWPVIGYRTNPVRFITSICFPDDPNRRPSTPLAWGLPNAMSRLLKGGGAP